MDRWIFGFITASFFSLIWPTLPPVWLLPVIFVLSIGCLYLSVGKIFSGFLIGTLWMASVGHWQLNWQLPSEEISQVNQVEGQIASLVRGKEQVRFMFSATKVNGTKPIIPILMRLSWRQPEWNIKQGQQVKIRVKLKPVHGLVNEGGFHYQQWLRSRGVAATGYVQESNTNQLLDSNISLRQALSDALLDSGLPNAKWLAALSLGDRSAFLKQDWELIQSTGVAHLVAISGLHLALVASVIYALFGWGFSVSARLFHVSQKFNFHIIVMMGTLICALGYAMLAGFQLPVIRAWIMMLVYVFLIINKLSWSPLHIILYSLFGIVFLYPMSLFSISIWLSFAAVVIIGGVSWYWPTQNLVSARKTFLFTMLKVQFALSLLLLPLVAWQFSFISFVSPLVNLLAVPYVTFILVPMCLLGVSVLIFNMEAGLWFFSLTDTLVGIGISGLNYIAALRFSSIDISASPLLSWMLATTAMVLLLIPKLPVHKSGCCLLFLPLISSFIPQSSQTWEVDVLDVGQGLSVLISRSNRVIIYDVGAQYPSGFNMADAVIIPLMQSRGITHLDAVFISHFDNDHAGSLSALLKTVSVGRIISPKNHCKKGWQYEWQGLSFRALWPNSTEQQSRNNNSCVLLISDGHQRVLLTGDIDRTVEKSLVKQYPDNLDAQVLIAPHHGSNTSSSALFIEATNPSHVVFSEGFQNRWDFPKQEVVNRYLRAGTRLYSTSEQGQISFQFSLKCCDPIEVNTYREHKHPFWYAN